MEIIFSLTYLVALIIQIISIIKFKNTKKDNYWNIFSGITVVNFIAVVLAYNVFTKNTLGLSSAVSSLFICGAVLIINVAVSAIGLSIKRHIKNKAKINQVAFISGILALLLNVVILFGLPSVIPNIALWSGEKQIIRYLNDKYGESNYKVVNVYEEYTNYGIWDKYLSGYYYEMRSDYMDDTFILRVDNNFNYVGDDYFLPVYYSQEYDLDYILKYNDLSTKIDYDFSEFDEFIKKLIEKQYPSENKTINTKDIYSGYVSSWSSQDGTKYSSNYYIIPANNGKIPTIQELAEKLVHDII